MTTDDYPITIQWLSNEYIMTITNFWPIFLDDHWSKMIYRPKMIVDPVLLFILRWSCSQSAVVMFGTNIEYVTLSAKLSVFVKYFTPETFSDNSKYTREKCIHGDILCVTFKIMEIVLTSNRRDNIALNHEMKKLYKRFFFILLVFWSWS